MDGGGWGEVVDLVEEIVAQGSVDEVVLVRDLFRAEELSQSWGIVQIREMEGRT